MARRITNELGNLPVPTGTDRLRTTWLQLKSKSNDLETISYSTFNVCCKSIEADLCISICSIFPENFKIPIEDLVIYGMGLKLFKDVYDMNEARERVRDLIKFINGSYLVTLHLEEDEYKYQYVRMFSGAHNLARSTALRHNVFGRQTVKGNWQDIYQYELFDGLSLVLKRISEHPVNFGCPKLVLLHLQYKEDSRSLPKDFFEGMKELRVLFLDIPSLPQTFSLPINLTTLYLKLLKSEDMSVIGGLINLEFLSISTLRSTDIPKEMGQLGNLRLLDLSKMNLAYVPPGVLSRMLKLEELYLPLSFRKWGCKAKEVHGDYDEWESTEEDDNEEKDRIITRPEIDGERINANSSEIASLPLNALQISVPKASYLPKKSLALKNIRQFRILVQNIHTYQPFGRGLSNKLQFSGDVCDIKEYGIYDLLRRTEDLSLTRVRNLKNFMCPLEDSDFAQLKKMIISECDELEYVIDTTEKHISFSSLCELKSLHLSMLSNLKEIWHGTLPHCRWFENLRQINIRFCHKLKYVFLLSMVRKLKQLRSVEILECREMEGIFCADIDGLVDDKTNDSCIIEELHLYSLPKLVQSQVQMDITNDDQLSNEEVVSNSMEGPTNDKELICPSPTSISTWKLQKKIAQLLFSSKQVPLMKNKDAISHIKMYSGWAFSSRSNEKCLQNLKKLKIAFCNALKVIFLFEENHASTGLFNCLEELELHGLRNLIHVWFSVPPEIIGFQNLEILVLSDCHNLYLLSTRVAKLLVKLRKLDVSGCEKMEEIIAKEDDKGAKTIMDKIVLSQLKALEFQRIPNLRIFYRGTYAIELPLLESLKLNECYKMKSFSYGSLRMPMLKRIQINGSSYPLTGDLNAIMKRVSR